MIWIVIIAIVMFIDLWMLRMKVNRLIKVIDSSLDLIEANKVKLCKAEVKTTFNERIEEMKRIKRTINSDRPSTVQRGHMPPMYYGYEHGTFSNVNRCKHCHKIGLCEDLHPIRPCPDCGGKIVAFGAAKWVLANGVYQWAERD